MKWFVLACLLCGGCALGVALRRREGAVAALVFCLGFLVFFNDISFTPGFIERYRGTDRGFGVSLFDVTAYVLYFAAPPAVRPAPFRAVRYAYFAVCLGSLALAPVPIYGAFTLWSLLKLYVMISALSRALCDLSRVPTLYKGLSFGVIYLLIVGLYQRYALGAVQVQGTFAHQNSMGMAAYMAAAVLFPLVLSGKAKNERLAVAAVASASLVVVLSLSRGCLVALPAILGAINVTSIVRKPTWRKVSVTLAGLAAALIIAARSFDTIFARFSGAPTRSAESRVIFEAMARQMHVDHPLGVGLNQFSHLSGIDGYMRVADAMDASWVEPGSLVHNIYLLTLAELGALGLLVYLAQLGHPLVMAARGSWRLRHDLRGELLFGAFTALLAFWIHGRLEWVARQDRASSLVWIICVLIAALSRAPEADASARRNGASRA